MPRSHEAGQLRARDQLGLPGEDPLEQDVMDVGLGIGAQVEDHDQ